MSLERRRPALLRRLLPLLAGLTAVAIVTPGQTRQPTPEPGPATASGLSDAQGLGGFFQALAAVQGGRRDRPVSVLQIGDSHSAADHISGGLRARLQARFGEGGRGVMQPGTPFAAYSPRQIDVTQSDGWRYETAAPGGYGTFGLAGGRLTAVRPGATLTLAAGAEGRFDRAIVCAAAGPGAGSLSVAAGDAGEDRHVMALGGPVDRPVCTAFEFTTAQTRLTLTSQDGPATLFSIASFRRSGGVAWSNVGVIGAQLSDFAARDDRVVAKELTAYAPDLIVLAFGTNEGARAGLDGDAYEALVRSQVQRLRRLAPAASILILGAPDSNTIRPDIPMDGVHNKDFDCAPLTPEEAAAYADLKAARSPALARWYPPPSLTVARDAQRRAAAAEGVAFWDWEARMGGPCSAHRLSRPEVKLMRGDHIHFLTAGGDWIASLLTDDLMAAYAPFAGAAGAR